MGILSERESSSRYYGDFRGVDFSSDHTQVHDQRFAYLVNMYKDYGSSQGQAVETVPGFRRRVVLPDSPYIHAIHSYRAADGSETMLIHAGKKLYRWYNYPLSVGVAHEEALILPRMYQTSGVLKVFTLTLPDNVYSVGRVTLPSGEDITINSHYDPSENTLEISRSDLVSGDTVYYTYTEGEITASDALFSSMAERHSISFSFNNRLYILDGENYLFFDGETVSDVASSAYIPTTYINIIPFGENADIGTEYEQRNILTPLFRHTFIPDGETVTFVLNENELDGIEEVKVYDTVLESTEYTVDLVSGTVTFNTAPKRAGNGEGEQDGYPEFYAGVEIIARKELQGEPVGGGQEAISSMIKGCTLAASFDNRVFFSGNPSYPNRVFYSALNSTGYSDPSYFGMLNSVEDGVTNVPITGIIPVADSLMVLKGDTRQDGSVYFHSRHETGIDIDPVIYPSSRGLAGIGCLGACVNFLDDPVFISRLGLEAVGQLSVRYERAIEHRSSLIDAKLVNMDLERAVLEEWNGYLFILIDGKVFLADSRQRYAHESGVMQYEWYYLEDIGIYDSQYTEYRYSSRLLESLRGKTVSFCSACHKGASMCTCDNTNSFINIPLKLADEIEGDFGEIIDLRGNVANSPLDDGTPEREVYDEWLTVSDADGEYGIGVYYTVYDIISSVGDVVGYEAHLCETQGNMTGGVFRPAVTLLGTRDNLYFGTESGVLCSFNFDMRELDGTIPPRFYDFDGRTIMCGLATKMDSCGVPHLNKNTVKKSTVIKTKAMGASAAKLKVRTNKKPYEQVARINSTVFSFDGTDFSDFSFLTTDQSLFAVKEKEKKWVEKQYYLYSDEFRKPFALFYIAFRYYITGRYKE